MANFFYRQGSDIFNASNNQRIGSDDWNKNWTGRATELKAIDGAKYNTKELQQANYSDIRAIGNTLYGAEIKQPKNTTMADVEAVLPTSEGLQLEKDRVNKAYENASANSAKAEKERIEAEKMLETKKAQIEAKNKLDTVRNERDTEMQGAKDDLATIRENAVNTAKNVSNAFSIDEEKALASKKKIDKYTSDLEKYYQDYVTDLDKTGHPGQLQSLNALERNKVIKNYDSKIGVTNALIALEQGNLNYAIDIVNKSADSITKLNQTEQETYRTILGFYETQVSEADSELTDIKSEYKEQYEGYIANLEEEANRIEENRNLLREYMSNPETASIAHDAGLTLTDTPDEWAEKLNRYFVNNPQILDKLSFDDKLELLEKGLVIDSDGSIVEAPDNVQTTLSIGSGIITGLNGSEYWQWGLDFVLAGGKGAEVKSPFIGEVIFAGENGGFGNQVKIRTASGEEIWLSHLDSVDVKVGDNVNSETVVGKQGNSGNVYSTSGGDGTHLDVTVKKSDGSYYSAPEVAELLGYKQSSQSSEFEQYSNEQIALSVLPTQLKNSENELERALEGIRAGLSEGKTPYEIADILMGYKVDEQTTFSDNMRQYISVGDLTENQISDMARLINNGKEKLAMSKVENVIMEKAKNLDPDGYIGETTAKTAIEKANNIDIELGKLDLENNPIGNFKGTFEDWLGRFKGEDAQKVKTAVTEAVKQMRKDLLGSAVTPEESKFLEPIIPNLGDTPENFMTKLINLQTEPLLRLNNVRSTYDLPELSWNELSNKDERLSLYSDYKYDNPGDEIDYNGMSNEDFFNSLPE